MTDRLQLTPGQRRRAFASMLIMVPLAGAATDIYVPSLPAMVHAYATTELAIQATLLIFMGCYGAGQIVAGPLTDTFGRRRPALWCTIGFVLASAWIALAPSLSILLTLRGVQGLLAGCIAVAARAIVADCYEGAARIKAANWMTIAWATGPILSPALGGYLQAWFGWTASFWFLAGWGVVVVGIIVLVLPATRVPRPASTFLPEFRTYGRMIGDRVYVTVAVGMACLVSVIYGFEVLAPFYIQHDFHRSPVFYGHLQCGLGLLWLGGNLFNRVVSPHVRVITIIRTCAGLALVVSATMVVLDLRGVYSVAAIALPVGAVYFLMATIWPNGYAACLARFPNAGGSANALVSGLFIIVSAVLSLGATILESTTAWPLWVLYTVVAGATLMTFGVLARRSFSHRVRDEEAPDAPATDDPDASDALIRGAQSSSSSRSSSSST